MTFALVCTGKSWFLRFVSRRIWAEVAVWKSSTSALARWGWVWLRYGFRFVNPLFGFSAGVWVV